MNPDSAIQARHDLPSALEEFDELVERMMDRQPAVFLDYDGVLTPIVAHPDLAVLDPSMRDTVSRLAEVVPLAVVSGRDTADVRDKVDVAGIWYAGSHGFDITDVEGVPIGGDELSDFDRFLPALATAADQADAAVAGVPGAHVERKRFAIAVHFRQSSPDDEPAIRAAVRAITDTHDELRMTDGKKIFELRPDLDWDKGRALEWIMQAIGLQSDETTVFYLGDDTTDEDAFRVIRSSGIGVVVGRDGPPTRARYALDDTDDVRRFLDGITRFASTT